ncbi:hypothetical protein T11_744 [Trichinella zimbabwensis]|uniref:Uncharacterized protein n=1 Tax=Trichinella zimbabwensis TaxID=268475 RepID=A0A0V1I594_9BILA|nr:hypothetical protein T11_744 [Trichinella zimbabwensis]
MGNQWTGCCIEVKSAVRSTCSALLLAIVSRGDTIFNANDKFGCDVSKWRQMKEIFMQKNLSPEK